MKAIKTTLLAIATCLSIQPSIATDRVLIMTISDYPEKPLKGVKFDADNALKLAGKLGYDTSQALIFRDQQLTAVGMREAFRSLADQVQKNDRVFVYFSGHGGSSFAKDGQCVQSLISQDISFIDTAELAAQFDRIKAKKPSDGIVVLDSCFSGGNRDIVRPRNQVGAGGKSMEGGLTSKAWTPKSGEQCDHSINRLAKSWQDNSVNIARGMYNPENNFTLVAAANEREEALDDEYKGGLATLGLLDCASKGVADLDGSQTVSIREISTCAQQYIAKRVPDLNKLKGTNFTPHSLEVSGNRDKTFPVRTKAVTSDPKDRASQVLASFNSYEKNSNGNFAFDLSSSSTEVAIGSEVQFTFSTGQPVYGYLLYIGSDRKDIQQLWPSAGGLHRIGTGNKTVKIRIDGPPGENTFMAVASQTPQDFSLFLASGSAVTSPQTLQAIGCSGLKSRNASLIEEDARCASFLSANNQGEILGDGLVGYAARVITIKGK